MSHEWLSRENERLREEVADLKRRLRQKEEIQELKKALRECSESQRAMTISANTVKKAFLMGRPKSEKAPERRS